MLSYQHGYHAGNFADVVKHLTLSRIINYLVEKDKPLLYLETHSGRGVYDLKDSQAKKTGEFLEGISLLWEKKTQLSPLFAPYLKVLRALNPTDKLRYYPGSPYLAISGLREQDRLVCCELHPREFDALTHLSTQGKKVFFNETDGMKCVNALLPPVERRGLTFIDPSYEIKDEYKQIPDAIKAAYTRFATGVYCLWYPIIDKRLHEQLIRRMTGINAERSLRIEFYLTGAVKPGMTGCGLWIINPPFTLAEEMKSILTTLKSIFNPGISFYIVE